jgi:hypothetical protein
VKKLYSFIIVCQIGKNFEISFALDLPQDILPHAAIVGKISTSDDDFDVRYGFERPKG